MRKSPVQIRYRRITRLVQMAQNVRFRLSKIGRVPSNVQPNPVSSPVNTED